jgi:2-C-methyl-D-erythritol 2,4-cyclodiphosphate synthase
MRQRGHSPPAAPVSAVPQRRQLDSDVSLITEVTGAGGGDGNAKSVPDCFGDLAIFDLAIEFSLPPHRARQIAKSPNRQIFVSGIGYDVHRFAQGRPLILGGVEIPHSHGLDGHSDADVLSHAIADAILGAIGERDIGHHFPNSDPSIRGISSLEIVRKAAELVAQHGGRVVNIDASLIAEAPKIAPYLAAMKAKLADALALPLQRVGIKATTNERLGFIGRQEGIAAMAVASVEIAG